MGKIVFISSTGLQEEYMISSVSSAESLSTEWDALAQAIENGE